MKTGTCLLKAPNILSYYFVSIKSLLSTTLSNKSLLAFVNRINRQTISAKLFTQNNPKQKAAPKAAPKKETPKKDQPKKEVNIN